MRWAVCTAIMWALLSGAALANDITPAKKLENVYIDYMLAQFCAEKSIVFTPDDVAKLTPVMKPYAQATGLTQGQRDEVWENVKAHADNVKSFVTQANCIVARKALAGIFPDVMQPPPRSSDNPF